MGAGDMLGVNPPKPSCTRVVGWVAGWPVNYLLNCIAWHRSKAMFCVHFGSAVPLRGGSAAGQSGLRVVAQGPVCVHTRPGPFAGLRLHPR